MKKATFLAFVFMIVTESLMYAFGNVPAGPEVVQGIKVKLLETKTYRNKKLGIEFEYPEKFKVREKDGEITVEHSVNFEHRDPCSENELRLTSKRIFDFYTRISILPLTPTELFIREVMQFNESGAAEAPKSSMRVTYGELDGFRVSNGRMGCGLYSYFFQITDESVLRVDRYPAPEFREVPESEKEMYRRVPNVILPEDEEFLFKYILSTLTFNKQIQ